MSNEVTVVSEESSNKGRWVKGQSGNPRGRPKKELTALQRDLEGAVREHLDPEKVKRLVDKVYQQAMDGNTRAQKLLFDKLIPNAVDSPEQAESGRTVVFRIENATFAAQQQQTKLSDKSAAIDVEVQTLPAQVTDGKS